MSFACFSNHIKSNETIVFSTVSKFRIVPNWKLPDSELIPFYEDRNTISNNIMGVPSFAFSSVERAVTTKLKNQVVLKLFSYIARRV